MEFRKPWVVFLGDATDQVAAKTGYAIAHFRKEWCVGQIRLPGCKADCGLPDLTLRDAQRIGAQTLLIGLAVGGGKIPSNWHATLQEAVKGGMDIINGMHTRLSEVPTLTKLADMHGSQLFDVRHTTRKFPLATGRRRRGKRLLTIGTDASIGKMVSSLYLESEFKKQGVNATFRATGQTGLLVSGAGVAIDAIPGDFVAGAIEDLTPNNDPDHWDIIEGQGSLFHPAYAGVSLGLLHGSQPDIIVCVHDSSRTHMLGVPEFPIPDLMDCIDLNLQSARLTNPQVQLGGFCVNTSTMIPSEANKFLLDLAGEFGVPACDPVRGGVVSLVSHILAVSSSDRIAEN